MQADQAGRLEHARLHHQHQRGAARDGADRRLLRIEQRHRLFERRRLHHFERNHRTLLPVGFLMFQAAAMLSIWSAISARVPTQMSGDDIACSMIFS